MSTSVAFASSLALSSSAMHHTSCLSSCAKLADVHLRRLRLLFGFVQLRNAPYILLVVLRQARRCPPPSPSPPLWLCPAPQCTIHPACRLAPSSPMSTSVAFASSLALSSSAMHHTSCLSSCACSPSRTPTIPSTMPTTFSKP